MSEYQAYQWIAVERPLSPKEQQQVGRLSSHIAVTPWDAFVEYHWSDFKHDPIKVLAKYFDVFLYWANWGTRRLAFRLPKQLLDPEPFQPYLTEETVRLYLKGESYILDIYVDEEPYDDDWVPERGAAVLAPLRESLLEGDYRMLYLAWLAGAWYEQIDDDQLEPPVPAGLKKPTPALRCFAKVFSVDKYLIIAAAEASPPSQPALAIPPEEAIGRLGPEERDGFLLRLLQGEPNLRQALRRRLQELVGQPTPLPAPERRMWGQLQDRAERLREAARRRAAKAAEEKRQRQMQAIAQQEPQLWEKAQLLVEQKKPSAYDEAVGLLRNLYELYKYQDRLPEFQHRLAEWKTRYPRLYGFWDRIRYAGLGQ